MSIIKRNNVQQTGNGKTAMVFSHGYGCDQNMWRFVAPAFQDVYRTVLFDHVGAGKSDLAAYDKVKYSSLHGYADDLVEICRELGLQNAVFVGHSVSSMIGMLASLKAPALFDALVMIGPSPRYINDDNYFGGFTDEQIEELLEGVEDNYMGWSNSMAPVIMGNADRPELAEELAHSFCRTDPEIAKAFARVTFTSDNRPELPAVQTRSLILQCSDDVIASEKVGEYLHEHLPNSELILLKATGHCPNLSAPDEVISVIKAHIRPTTQ